MITCKNILRCIDLFFISLFDLFLLSERVSVHLNDMSKAQDLRISMSKSVELCVSNNYTRNIAQYNTLTDLKHFMRCNLNVFITVVS